MKNLIIIKTILLVLSISFFSCEKEEKDDNSPNLRNLKSSELEVIESTNNFAFDLLKTINAEETGENVFISPLSIGMALAMTYNGADGETKKEMSKVLGFDETGGSDLNEAYKGVYELLMDMDKEVNLSLANAIWYKNQYTVNADFAKITRDYYDAEISPIDVSDPNAKDIINEWVEDKTNKKIKDLITQVRPSDVMFLVNAIYFNADWKYQFDKDLTKEASFNKEDGSTVNCKMMEAEEIKLKTKVTDSLILYSLPYGNGQFNMVILLPANDLKVDNIIAGLSSESLGSLINTSSEIEATFKLPKFKVEYEKELKDILIAMGIEKAFSPEAEFTNLFENINGDGLNIDRVKHKSFINVDEKGTEAAAATAVVINELSAPAVITIDQPFVYFIRENHTGTILFSGKLMDPS